METFSFSHDIYRSRNQRIFELQKSIIYRVKELEKLYPTMMFWKTLTETTLLKKPENEETILSNLVCQWKVFNNDDILYIVEKVLKNAIQQKNFQKHQLKLYHWKNSKTVKLTLKHGICQWKIFSNSGVLYIIGKALTGVI